MSFVFYDISGRCVLLVNSLVSCRRLAHVTICGEITFSGFSMRETINETIPNLNGHSFVGRIHAATGFNR